MRIFLSYSSKDTKEVFRACDILERNGNKCFIAPRDIQLGKEYAEQIVNGIDNSDAMILFLTANANKSPHVLREVERAVSKSIPILVCKLEEVEISKSMEYFLMAHQWVNVGIDKDYTQLLQFVDNMSDLNEQNVVGQSQKPGFEKKKYLQIAAIAAMMLLMLGTGIFIGVRVVGKGDTTASEGEELLGNEAKESTQQTAVASPIEVGDTVSFGNYNDEPISWRVLKIKEDGMAVLISKDILTMKAFDAAESGKYNWDGNKDYWGADAEAIEDAQLQTLLHGNSDWSKSNIRAWLNSDEEVVTYADQPPKATAMAEVKNGYHNEPGFLHDFTEEELAAVQQTEIVTRSNSLSEAENVTTMDRVYLLSLEELQWFTDAGISQLAVPTRKAVEQDQSNWYSIDKDTYGVAEYCWWLREPVKEMASKCYLVGNGYWDENVRQEDVGLEGYGVRPAITVDLTAECFNQN